MTSTSLSVLVHAVEGLQQDQREHQSTVASILTRLQNDQAALATAVATDLSIDLTCIIASPCVAESQPQHEHHQYNHDRPSIALSISPSIVIWFPVR